MISRKAVDPVSGEMSPVIGARLNPESRLVVPVTQASSAHRKPKPPPGALGMLEEEIVARRGYWRRQRQREAEVVCVCVSVWYVSVWCVVCIGSVGVVCGWMCVWCVGVCAVCVCAVCREWVCVGVWVWWMCVCVYV